ncbi:oligosaccharide flippase family protein [bacterium]|nr:oligosaccharide flippase family protein [bacterium]
MARNSFVSDTVWISVSRAVTILFKFILDVIIANEAGKELYGGFSYYLLLILTLSTFLSFGIQSANNYFISSGAISVARVKRININFMLGVTVLGMVIFALFTFRVNRTLSEYISDNRLLILGGTGFALLVLNNVTVSLLQSLKKIRAYSVVFTLSAVVLCAAFGTIFRVVPVSMRSFIIVYVAALFVADAAGLAVLGRVLKTRSEPSPGSDYRMFFRYGVTTYLCSVAIFFLPRIDMFIINAVLPVEHVGYYRIALNIAEKIIFISIAVAALLKPTLPSMRKEESIGFIKRISRINFLMIVLIVSAVYAGAGLLMTVFRAEYAPALQPLRLLLIASVFLSMNTILDEFFLGRKKPGLNLISYVSGFIVKAAVSYPLISRWGITGAAVSTIATYIVILAVKLLLLRKQLKPADLIVITKEDLLYVLKQLRIQ